MPTHYDVIVAGLGATGSLTLHALAARGHQVLGIDRYAPPHAHGSSHGRSRIIREAYFEDPCYVPLVQRAYDRWAALETDSGETLFQQTGGLMLGPPDGALVQGARRSAELHDLPHAVLTAGDVEARFPAFRPTADMVGVWEPRAGILDPERAVQAALRRARENGATLQLQESLVSWEPYGSEGGVTVTTSQGQYTAQALVLALGPWTTALAPELALPLVVQRNMQLWFAPLTNAWSFTADRFPVFIAEHAPDVLWYGFPDTGSGMKIARHHHGPTVDPDGPHGTLQAAELDSVRALVAQYLPDANGALLDSTSCLYTTAPDQHFVIGRHPLHASVIVASPCSGHGFKFASAVGEALADLATGGTPAVDLSPFSLQRFARG